MLVHKTVIVIIISLYSTLVTSTSSSSSSQSSCNSLPPQSSSLSPENELILTDIHNSLKDGNNEKYENDDKFHKFKLSSAINDFSTAPSEGRSAWNFLSGMASSPTFRRHYWHKRPLLIRAKDTGGWVKGAFTLERDLRMIHNSYISGHRTHDLLRNGTNTSTWSFLPLKPDPTVPTTWDAITTALQNGTIYFNTAGSQWANVGALCRLTSYAFGLPTNVNIYVSPPTLAISVPPHTDRQDVIVMQTQGAKRWRVFAPPKRRKGGADPLQRGKNGDVLSFEEMGEPLIDDVLRGGDVLYVPAGFPHTTDTSTVVGDAATDGTDEKNEDDDDDDGQIFDDTSIHLTMGLDTHVWGLTYAHLRWCLLQRAQLDFNLSIESDDLYWQAMETIPIGFLGTTPRDDVKGQKYAVFEEMKKLSQGIVMDETSKKRVIDDVKQVLVRLEPNRWELTAATAAAAAAATATTTLDDKTKEPIPNDDAIAEVIDYIFGPHLRSLLELQEEMFSNINSASDETMMKAFQCVQKQNAIMEQLGAFSKNK